MHVVNGHEFDSAESSIDSSDELVDASPEVLILLHILSRRDGQLDEHDLCYELL